LVQESIYEKFLNSFLENVKKWKVGDPSDSTTNMGALISKEHLGKVRSYIDIAVKEGGKIVYGGDQPHVADKFKNGYWLNPTIITGITANSTVQQDEIFGPVVTILTFKNEEEAIALANNSKYGLAASLWTGDSKRAHRVSRRINSGIVWVNCWMYRDLRTPFGGMGASGCGDREGGELSIEAYTETKTICMKYS